MENTADAGFDLISTALLLLILLTSDNVLELMQTEKTFADAILKKNTQNALAELFAYRRLLEYRISWQAGLFWRSSWLCGELRYSHEPARGEYS